MSQLWATTPDDDGCLGITFFYTKNHPAESCGTNGLPLTPNTTKVQGLFKELQKVVHDGLCLYVDILKAKHDKIILVQEHYTDTIWKLTEKEGCGDIVTSAFNILKALECLHRSGYQHGNLSVDTALLTKEGKVKLSQYGVLTLSGLGEYVSFPVGSPQYMSPESLLLGCRNERRRSWSSTPTDSIISHEKHFLPSSDIWAFGILLLELVSKRRLWKKNIPVAYILVFILRLLKGDEDSAIVAIAAELGWEDKLSEKKASEAALDISVVYSGESANRRMCQRWFGKFRSGDFFFKISFDQEDLPRLLMGIPQELFDLISACLTIDPRKRPNAAELIVLPVFANLNRTANGPVYPLNFLSTNFRAGSLTLSPPASGRIHPLRRRSYFELYYLWKLAGGDAEAELKKHGLTKSKPPICTLPRLCIVEGETFGSAKDDYRLYDRAVVTVSFDALLKRLESIPEEAYFPLLAESSLPPDKDYTEDSLSLPLVIREGDIEYQLHRIVLFERLLKGYPYTRDKIVDEARKDIPPLYRGEVWAAILGVIGDVQGRYQDIDKESPAATDRQIEVDIPRCHQYIDLLASPVAHAKFKRVLKAWIVSHPEYVYWQGLDSLCAPFLLLNFNDEALAYASLSAFIPKYLNGFFRRDNSSVMQEYLTKFSQLLAFHDPLLSVHLAEVRFVPELYAIPWFLTMFAHVFPLQKIFHLWDTLLLGSASFPLFVGLAILRQLRELLMASGFNECISYFSNMPEIDMERCLRDSKEMCETTPPSATFRQHERKEEILLGNTAVLNSLSPRTPIAEEENEMGITYIPLEELKTEKCLRISAEDLVDLLMRNELFAVDIRQAQDYNLGAIPESINLPFIQCFNQSEDRVTKVPPELTATKKTVVVVSGGRGHEAACLFASALLKLGIHRVCVLHKGVDSLRKTNILTLPA